MGDVVVRPSRVFITDHLVQHDGVEYPTGSEFNESLATPEQIAHLRKVGAIKLREELEAADKLAAERVALESELASVKAQLAEVLATKDDAAKSKAKLATAPKADDAPAS